MADDPELRAHREWLGYLQPVGVVVSPPALAQAQAYVNRNVAPLQAVFAAQVADSKVDGKPAVLALTDLPGMLKEVFGWRDGDLVEASNAPDLEVVLPDYSDVIRPDFAVPEPEPVDGGSRWQLLVLSEPLAADLDIAVGDGRGWEASPQARMERLLRETGVPVGLLSNGTSLRLVYSPRGETSGYLTFPVEPMTEVSGRPILAALEMLLGSERLFNLPRDQRLPGLLAASRRYQNEVSIKLAGQVLGALYELLRGLQSADNQTGGKLLAEVLQSEPDEVYAGLLTVLLRLVFLLYAEDRGLMPAHEVYTRYYSVSGLFERLRADSGQHPDTMDQRYGAWAHLLSVFRLVHDGAIHGDMRLPARHGHLFDPDRYSFLEGRPLRLNRVLGERIEAPLISDGVISRVLESLLVLDGERLSYRSLDVEQIGSVYETIMGFGLGLTTGPSVALRPSEPHGAPIVVDVGSLLAVTPARRGSWIKEQSGRNLTPRETKSLEESDTVAGVLAALDAKVDRRATPNVVPPGAMVLHPSGERRRSGSHYTPRSLTEPIVRRTLEPVLGSLGPSPTPAAILEIKVLDPAMGSGAFLVEASRQLAQALVEAWHHHGEAPPIPADEDELLLARRMVAQRCLHGVDLNPMAVDLAKLSLWLATLARDHDFTFLDHAFKWGDSLVGLNRQQISSFHWSPSAQRDLAGAVVERGLKDSAVMRQSIRTAREGEAYSALRRILREADEAVADARLVGDLAVAAFFEFGKPRERENHRLHLAETVQRFLTGGDDGELRDISSAMREGESPVVPLHWEIEFPEVFSRENPGFDVLVGNPPFLGGRRISTVLGMPYLQWLKAMYPPAGDLCDLVAYFFRRAYFLLRRDGCFGLVATNTISQGDTREGGLVEILRHNGSIVAATRRLPWPGQATVVVSVVHVQKGAATVRPILDRQECDRISAYLFPGSVDSSPATLKGNPRYSSGSKIYGQGFVFDDSDPQANPTSLMRALLGKNAMLGSRIWPYIGGEEVNSSPVLAPHRYVIYLSDIQHEEGLQEWPELAAIIREKVKPERDGLVSNANNIPLKRRWWAYQAHRPELYAAARSMSRVLVNSHVSTHLAFAFLPSTYVYSHRLVVILLEGFDSFALLQSRIHELWARRFSSTLGDALNYSPEDCFATFPFPATGDHAALEHAGEAYYRFRAELMARNDEGLTKTYNRLHDPAEVSPDVLRLRKLHDGMDRHVLASYGWTDLATECEFLLEYEDEESDEASNSRRRKPWRYRWPDDVRDEVLTRLLELNRERSEAEATTGQKAEATDARARSARKRRSTLPSAGVQTDLLGEH